jgi:hypothetical protein
MGGVEMKTYTQQQAAEILKPEYGTILDRMTHGYLIGEERITSASLQPSIIIKKPVEMQRIILATPDDGELFAVGKKHTIVTEKLDGLFGITGNYLQWNGNGLAHVTFGEWPPDKEEGRTGKGSRVLLYRNGYRYMVKDAFSIQREELVVTEEDLLRYGMETVGVNFELPSDRHTNRHDIKPDEWKSKDKSAIQIAIEAFLDSRPDGYKIDFYTFLKTKLKLTTEEILKDAESYPFYFKEVKEAGCKEGVYLNHPKEGKKEGTPGYNHYSGANISSLISREKAKRKK